MKKKIEVHLWTDLVCPYCYIGVTYLYDILKQRNRKDAFEIVSRSYQLVPDQKREDKTYFEKMSGDYGLSVEEFEEEKSALFHLAKDAGKTLHLENLKYANSLKGHQLVKKAEQLGKDALGVELAYGKAYFEDNEYIDEDELGIAIAARFGIEEETVKKLFHSTEFVDEIHADTQEANEFGLDYIPYFKYKDRVLSGVLNRQKIEAFLDSIVLEQQYSVGKGDNA